MEEALGFFRAFETWIYLLLGLGGLYYIRKFVLAWQELRSASFGLERESAQSRLNQSASILVLLLTMAVTEFILVSFIAPAMPGPIGLPTPTLNLLATPSITLPAETLQAGEPQTTETPAAIANSRWKRLYPRSDRNHHSRKWRGNQWGCPGGRISQYSQLWFL